jgi:hypothetical protein
LSRLIARGTLSCWGDDLAVTATPLIFAAIGALVLAAIAVLVIEKWRRVERLGTRWSWLLTVLIGLMWLANASDVGQSGRHWFAAAMAFGGILMIVAGLHERRTRR